MGAASLGWGGRVIAASLAIIWLLAGFAAVVMGVWLQPGALPIILGLLAIGYGGLWLRVAITGRRQAWPFGSHVPKDGTR